MAEKCFKCGQEVKYPDDIFINQPCNYAPASFLYEPQVLEMHLGIINNIPVVLLCKFCGAFLPIHCKGKKE